MKTLFLNFFSKLFPKFFAHKHSEALVQDEEQISRYLLTKNDFARSKGRVRFSAFLPSSSGQTSIYRTSGLSTSKIWEIGREFVAIPRNKPLLGRGYMFAFDIRKTNLSIDEDTTPHKLHANIVGWPSEKNEKMMIAKELEAVSKLHLCE